jgi:hypothetical protein
VLLLPLVLLLAAAGATATASHGGLRPAVPAVGGTGASRPARCRRKRAGDGTVLDLVSPRRRAPVEEEDC